MATIKSLEEKVKAYDEAIERAKSKIKNDKDHVLYEEDIIDIFPELKESEDEKIRKELIEFVKSRGGFKQEYIAWLEKQGEHANFRNKIQIGDKVTRNEDGVLVNLSQLKRVAKPVEPMIVGQEPLYDYTNANICQKDFAEQKPADKVEPKFKVKYAGCEYDVLEVKDTAGVTYYGIEDEPNHIDYVKADNCEIISGGYGIKENGSPYPTKPAVFEVDLDYIEEELNRLIRIHKPNEDFDWGTLYNVATHFFELGLAQKGENV